MLSPHLWHDGLDLLIEIRGQTHEQLTQLRMMCLEASFTYDAS